MADEVVKRTPKRRAAPPSPEVKRARLAQLYDAQVAVYEGMGHEAADVMKSNRELFLGSDELLELLDKFRPDMPEETAREYGKRLGAIIDSLMPKPEPVTLGEPYFMTCGICRQSFDMKAPGPSMTRDGLTFVFNIWTWRSESLSGPGPAVCPACTLKLCKEVVIEKEREGVTE